MGVIKKQTGATDKEKKELGIPIQDDVVVQKDQKGNITDFKITSLSSALFLIIKSPV